MPDAASIGVLRDLVFFVSIATALALGAYRLLRHFRPHVAWNHEGQVLSRPYGMPDLLVVMGMGLLFVSGMVMAGQGGDVLEDQGQQGTGMAGLVSAMMFNFIVCAGLLGYLHRVRGLNPAELFGLQHFHWRWLLKVTLVFAVFAVIAVNAVSALTVTRLQDVWPDVQPQEAVQLFQKTGGIGMKALFIFSVVILAPLAEETVFRGFVYGVLKRYTDAPFAALSSSLMFAIVHMHVGSLLPLCLLAVVICVAYEITGCLLVPMLLHMIFNGTSIIMMMAVDAG